MRCAVIKTGEKSFKFVWSFHHIILDGWSYPIIQKEVFTIYEALSEGREINLPVPLPYKQYILWLNEKNKSTSENFWKKEFMGLNAATPIVASGKINESGSEDTEEQTLKLSAELTSGLQLFARNNQLTLNTIIQGVWGIILSEYTGEKDVLFGSTVSGRTSSIKGVESMVGLFINSLPTRIKVNKENEIIPWLKELQDAHILRDEYFYTSLVDIQEWSGLPKTTQLFDNLLVFENYPVDRASLTGSSGIKVLNVKAIEKTSFPLTILVAPGEELSITFLYETAKIEKETVAQILSSFKSLLESISKNTFSKISEFSLLSNDEENKIIYEWNNTKHVFPGDKSVSELFEEAAKKYADKTAVEFKNESLTYTQLNERANRLAHYLRKLGVGPDVKVGISIERSAEMAIGILAILKAGGAYVPLDPSNPAGRLSYMIEDSGIPVLLTQSKLREKFQNEKIKTVLIDSEESEINKESNSNPALKDHSSNLAYVIYTSGSTGKPKGVLMKQEALTNLLFWQLNGQKFEHGYRVLQFTTLSFDVSFQEIFSTWLSGGTLVMMTELDRQDLAVILNTIIDKKIQRLFLPFIALQELAELFPASGVNSDLKEVITAGEQLQCTPAIVNLFKQLKDFTFSNHYGPTEAHVVTSYTLSNDPDSWVKLPPIGKPVFNVQMHILNSYLKPVPVGVSGDLYIGGTCLARGYHNNEELTKEKFIDNPFYEKGNWLSQKLYKTGDLAKYMSDGSIEYLGRSDSQIKLRGYRIELGEIESVLAEYPGMKSAAVVAREFSNGDKRLIAYYVSRDESVPSSSDVKNFMKIKLPEYMIPSDYIKLDEMPLTATGKINHRELPSPDFIRINESSNYEEPKDSLELQLTKIWEKVLGISPIGIKDNFFNLGGNSLLALRLFGYIEKLTGKRLALSILFDSPTIEELALILKNEGWTPPWKSLVPVKSGGSKLPFFCVPPAGGTALHFQNLVGYISDDQPMYVLESIGLDGQEPPHTNLEEMAAHYIKEIQTLQPDGPYLLGGRCFGGRVVFEMAQQFVKLGQKVALLAIFDTWPPFY
ncbi:MAG: amino acid adenylation domain-containing protein [Ignavibacteria bacterium]|nr:amino acid adenylation domain-containing protein [Ignavibacteria bacterium]